MSFTDFYRFPTNYHCLDFAPWVKDFNRVQAHPNFKPCYIEIRTAWLPSHYEGPERLEGQRLSDVLAQLRELWPEMVEPPEARRWRERRTRIMHERALTTHRHLNQKG